MEYKLITEEGYSRLIPEGDIKTSDSKGFEERMLAELEASGKLIVDFEKIEYICSSGLRALLAVQQAVDELDDGEFIITNVGEEVMSVIKSTGFHNVLTIK